MGIVAWKPGVDGKRRGEVSLNDKRGSKSQLFLFARLYPPACDTAVVAHVIYEGP